MGPISATADRGSIGANAAYALTAQLTGAVFTAGLTIFLARYLGTRSYGILSLALGVSGLALIPSDLGISNSVARVVAEQHGNRGEAAVAVRDALGLKLVIATLFAAIVFVLAPPIAQAYHLSGLVWPLRGTAIALLGQNVMQIGAVFEAGRRTELQWVTALAESSAEALATILLVLAGAGAAGAAFGQAVGYAVGGGATVLLLVRLLGPGVLPRGFNPGPYTRRIAVYGGVLLLVDGAYTVFSQIDALIIAADRHASQVAVFSAPMRLTVFLAYPGGALAAGVAPRMARGPGSDPDVAAFTGALRILLIVQMGVTALVLGWAALIVKVALGGGYSGSAAALRELAPYIFLGGFGALVSMAANYLGAARRRLPIAVAAVVVNLVLDLVLIPHLGVAGACIGTDAAFALYVPAHLLICRDEIGMTLRPLLGTTVRAAAAGAAMYGVMALLGDSWRHPLPSILGLLLGLVAFGAVLLLGGELDGQDRARVAALARSLRRGSH